MKITDDKLQELIDRFEVDTFNDNADLLNYVTSHIDDLVNSFEELQLLRKELDRVAVFLAVHNFPGYKFVEDK